MVQIPEGFPLLPEHVLKKIEEAGFTLQMISGHRPCIIQQIGKETRETYLPKLNCLAAFREEHREVLKSLGIDIHISLK